MPYFWLRLNDLLSHLDPEDNIGPVAHHTPRSQVFPADSLETFDTRGVISAHVPVPAAFLQRGVVQLGNGVTSRGQMVPTDITTLRDNELLELILPARESQWADAVNPDRLRNHWGFVVGGIGLLDGRRWDHVLLSTGNLTPGQFTQSVLFPRRNYNSRLLTTPDGVREGLAIDFSRHEVRNHRERGTRNFTCIAFRRPIDGEVRSLEDIVRVDSWINGQDAIARGDSTPGPLELLHCNPVIRNRDTGVIHCGWEGIPQPVQEIHEDLSIQPHEEEPALRHEASSLQQHGIFSAQDLSVSQFRLRSAAYRTGD